MNLRATKVALAAFFTSSSITLLPSIASAHYLWAYFVPKDHAVRIGLQEMPSEEALPLGERSASVTAWMKVGSPIRMKPNGNFFVLDADEPLAASLDYGVVDRSDAGRGVYWLKYYAKACPTLETASRNLGLAFEISAEHVDKGTLLTVTLNGRPLEAAEVTIAGADRPAGKTGGSGHFLIREAKEAFAIRVGFVQKAKGRLSGKSYDLIRLYSTLTVGPQSGSVKKPLTSLIRQAFGNDHAIVSHTAFIETVMSGKLTKSQLLDHLRQRALIHEEIDRALRSVTGLTAYGPDQRAVLDLLKGDIKIIGGDWPQPSDAWVLTAGLLKSIKESETKGPYYALGIFHVYFGGITHGGRDIAAEIERQLGVKLTYYTKSEGYESYVKAVNEIQDAEAQHEMIRGGIDAYNYIIAIDNLDVFKAAESGY